MAAAENPSVKSRQLPESIETAFGDLKRASRMLRSLAPDVKASYLNALARDLVRRSPEILKANKIDLAALPAETIPSFRDRLTLNLERIEAMAESLRQVARLPDPVGEIVESRRLANGLQVNRVRAPLGVIFMIFESRPNVALEAFSLAFKSGNAIALRGGSESKETTRLLYQLMRDTCQSLGLDPTLFYGFDDYDRSLVETLLKRKDLIDIVVPRGGDRLIEYVEATSLMPIIKNDRGLCHAYVAEDADLEMAVRIVTNGKVQRPGVCNSLETVLVHRAIAPTFLPLLYRATNVSELKWVCDEESYALLEKSLPHPRIERAREESWGTEYLDLILNSRIVSGLDEALSHIDRYGSKHSETIITSSQEKARHFQNEIDAAVVYWNASTRFTDGFELGLGGELGISTQKLHVRGPVGLRELTTPRWIIDGDGQIRV